MQANEKRLWIDGHTHLDFHREDGSLYGYTLDDVLKVLDDSGDDLRMLCGIGANEIRRIGADPEAIHAANEAIHQFIRPSGGRLLGNCFVRPDALAQAHADLDLYIGERGFVQVGEVVGQVEGGLVDGIYGRMDGPGMIEIARHAAQLGAPLQFHCSRQVPEAKVILAHAIGGRNTYQHILAAETYLADGGDNIYLEIIDFHIREYVRAAYERLGADRLLVGTDWMNRGEPPFPRYGGMLGMLYPERNDWSHLHGSGWSRWGDKLWLASHYVVALNESPYPSGVATLFSFLREAGVSEQDATKIASGNAIRLFGLQGRL